MSTEADGRAGLSEAFRRELEAERELRKSLDESAARLAPKCPACGMLGTLEEIDGVVRCIECDDEVIAVTKLSGFGRR
jgi:predicted Zn-ribbon and HTH transcriptional regulator